MTTTIAQTQQGSQIGQTQTITAVGSSQAVDATFTSGLYRYQLSLGAMLGYPLQWVATVSGASNGNTFIIVTISDPDRVSAIVNDALLPLDQIPVVGNPLIAGTAPYVELARRTITTNGTYTFDLDLTMVTPIMAAATSPTNTWNGSLLLWLYTINGASGTWSNPSLTAGVFLDRANRDTGRSQAPEGSRMDRCPITGLMVSRQKMVIDGFTGIYVHPTAWDPAEPEPFEWGDYPDPNEGGGT